MFGTHPKDLPFLLIVYIYICSYIYIYIFIYKYIYAPCFCRHGQVKCHLIRVFSLWWIVLFSGEFPNCHPFTCFPQYPPAKCCFSIWFVFMFGGHMGGIIHILCHYIFMTFPSLSHWMVTTYIAIINQTSFIIWHILGWLQPIIGNYTIATRQQQLWCFPVDSCN